ncbi:MAG: UDP-N-acetylmuramoyl-L-alanine--D-glutamate ligase [Eubacteriales bacterium]|nr:UDP-N-acetylmuramoyl-L-alanine--D-glutamate ligase [Eubacteriales bacterium]
MKNIVKNKKVLIIGMGKSGIAATQALLKLEAQISVQDTKRPEQIDPQLISFLKGKNVKCYFGCVPENIGEYHMLILSPGVSVDLNFIAEAKEKGVEIIGELEIAYRIGQGKYIAITGTNGKTTTTTLAGEIFKAAKRKTYVVGNIGVAVISMALTADDDSWLVTETSSFQLETTKDFKPEISAILNITPDHMDRHKTMENYEAAKAKIFKNQTEDQYLVINDDDPECVKLAQKAEAKVVPFSRKKQLHFGIFVKDGNIVIKNEKQEIIEICAVSELRIPGAHNVENALAAVGISYFAGIEPEIIRNTLKEFLGVEHRLEYVDTVDGVRFVNDSKGTNAESSIKAIEAVDAPIILIAGGYDKGGEFDELINAFNGKVKQLLLIGKTAEKIKQTAEKLGFSDYIVCNNLDECVRRSFEIANPGDTVLLSPACASWDMYTCFEQRGEHFKSCVKGLSGA